jgi:hypothetical protein
MTYIFIMILTALFFQNVIQKILSKRRFVFFSSIVFEPLFPLYLPLMIFISDKDATDFIREKAAEGNIAKKSMLVILLLFLAVALPVLILIRLWKKAQRLWPTHWALPKASTS